MEQRGKWCHAHFTDGENEADHGTQGFAPGDQPFRLGSSRPPAPTGAVDSPLGAFPGLGGCGASSSISVCDWLSGMVIEDVLKADELGAPRGCLSFVFNSLVSIARF